MPANPANEEVVVLPAGPALTPFVVLPPSPVSGDAGGTQTPPVLNGLEPPPLIVNDDGPAPAKEKCSRKRKADAQLEPEAHGEASSGRRSARLRKSVAIG